MSDLVILTGNANPSMAKAIATELKVELGQVNCTRFSDGEVFVEVRQNVRDRDVYLVQPTCQPVNDNLMELLIMTDALKRASAKSITAVMPYFGYARQDRKVAPRTPISAKLVSDLMQAAGVSRVVSVDLHAGQIQGFFNIPFDHLFAMPLMIDHMRKAFDLEQTVIVSPDAGGMERARAYGKRLGVGIAMIDKRRERANVSEVMNIIGEVEGKTAVLLDDMVDTAGTLVNAASALLQRGARRVFAYATHGVLSGPALERLNKSDIEKLVVSDSIPQKQHVEGSKKIEVLTIGPLLAEAIRRIHFGESVSSLFV
ncbi:MAG: ribose-phosphate pyrophosphokinase [Deltaproteobacteria bacterium]|nr:ribose-phosphate pyrophosphokinase [Deltaproteobacteria bacterium]